ncbi:hypothetical protein [uncultured Campylobacter sp.]|uniref:hypothetical protein n=1 Tax=uncultured Campylobacter sp. TaxID=218934 RepID=UPI0026255387|nr:hypothetical protein [uncultured Campylobacter sp.]
MSFTLAAFTRVKFRQVKFQIYEITPIAKFEILQNFICKWNSNSEISYITDKISLQNSENCPSHFYTRQALGRYRNSSVYA